MFTPVSAGYVDKRLQAYSYNLKTYLKQSLKAKRLVPASC